MHFSYIWVKVYAHLGILGMNEIYSILGMNEIYNIHSHRERSAYLMNFDLSQLHRTTHAHIWRCDVDHALHLKVTNYSIYLIYNFTDEFIFYTSDFMVFTFTRISCLLSKVALFIKPSAISMTSSPTKNKMDSIFFNLLN